MGIHKYGNLSFENGRGIFEITGELQEFDMITPIQCMTKAVLYPTRAGMFIGCRDKERILIEVLTWMSKMKPLNLCSFLSY